MPLEVCDAVAALDPATGRVMLTLSTEAPHMMRTGIADVPGTAEAELRARAPTPRGISRFSRVDLRFR